MLEYWIVDLAARALLVHQEPRAGAYRSVESYADGATVTALAPGAPPVDVSALLG